jgi:light-regulated signal transduction histidine kinase (bacteriophytochrome)
MNHDQIAAALAVCAKEPIHVPGKIQPHGALLAVSEPDLVVRIASANCDRFFGVAAESVLGTGLDRLLSTSSCEAVDAALRSPHLAASNPLRIEVTHAAHAYDGILHRSGGLAVLELEPAPPPQASSFRSFYQRVNSLSQVLQTSRSIAEIYEITARVIKELTSFDRVLVYRFDDEWSGQVVGEAKEPEQDSYLDLRYPASDIPPQARQLYRRNRLRIIPDVGYEPAPLVAAPDVAGRPLDLSDATLRSVSPVHIQYLKNFGAGASMSASIIKEGELWGLIACTHRMPRYAPYDIRLACEFLSEVFSFQLIKLESRERLDEQQRVHATREKLERLAAAKGVVAGLLEQPAELLGLTDATGAALVLKGKIRRLGKTPSADDVRAVATWLRQNHSGTLFHSDRLQTVCPAAESFVELGAGLLAVALDAVRGDYLLWFRGEVVRTVNWGGNPEKPVVLDEREQLTPRRSFALWKEQVRGRSTRWERGELEGADELRRALVDQLQHAETRKLNLVLEAKAAKLESLNAAKDEFLALVSHELRSPLNAIIGYAELLRHEKPGSRDFEQAIDAIIRNTKTQAQLVADLLDVSRIITGKLSLDVAPVDVRTLVDDATDSVRFQAQTKGVRIEVRVAPMLGPIAADATRLKQVLWNLLSNSIKFTPAGGKVTLAVERRQSMIELRVIDTGQGIEPAFLPYVFDRFRQESASMATKHGGLGLGLAIVKHIAELHHGTVWAESAGKDRGATFVVKIPIAEISLSQKLRPTDRAPSLSRPRARHPRAPSPDAH